MDTECTIKPINIHTYKRVQDEVHFKGLVYERMWRVSSDKVFLIMDAKWMLL